MRMLPARLLVWILSVVALVAGGAPPVGAWAVAMNVRGGGPLSSFTTSDTVTLDLLLDAEPGLQSFSVSVLHNDVLGYDPVASASLPIVHAAPPASYGTTGARPAYILYAPGPPAAALYPVPGSAAWPAWPSPPAGKGQEKVDYATGSLASTLASGTGIWIASLVLHVTAEFDTAEIFLDPGGIIIQANGSAIDPASVILPEPIVLTGHAVPEPLTGLLMGAGLVVAAAASRRR